MQNQVNDNPSEKVFVTLSKLDCHRASIANDKSQEMDVVFTLNVPLTTRSWRLGKHKRNSVLSMIKFQHENQCTMLYIKKALE